MLEQRRRRWANIEPTLGEYIVFAQTAHVWPIVGLMLEKRRRRWANIKITLVQCIVFEWYYVRL